MMVVVMVMMIMGYVTEFDMGFGIEFDNGFWY